MPGRTSARSTRPSTASAKSLASSHPSRSSTISRNSIAAPEPLQDAPPTQLRSEICTIFADSQKTTSGHRKLVVRLRKVQEACCYVSQSVVKKKSPLGHDFEEADFNAEVERCVLRVVGVRKAEAAGDRVVRFLGLFLKSANEKDLTVIGQDANAEDTQNVPETPTSRLTFSLLSLLIPLLSTREKTVRYRATQIIAHVVNTLDSIDDELYHLIRQGLTRRIRDKEPTVRTQAVMGLGRLAGNEAQEEPGSDNSTDMASLGLLERLLDALQHDTSAEVRRTLLLNLPLTPATLPCLLERARDLDSATRRALYARLLPTLGDFRHLSLSMREKLLRWGLRDRDENVRKAAGRLFHERWIEDCAGNSHEASDGGPVKLSSPSNMQSLLELLERIDIVNSGVETGIAIEAMNDFWQGRPDYMHVITLDNIFWSDLTPESAFIVRSFIDFCQQHPQYHFLCEAKMPEVTRLGFYLQKYMNTLLESIKGEADRGGGGDEADDGEEGDFVEQEFVVEQLLHIALTLDYSDEVGRRKMFSLLRETLAMPELPEEVTRLVIDVLRSVCGPDASGEREFCSVVLEAIAEVHDHVVTEPGADGEQDSFVSAHSDIHGDGVPSKAKAEQASGENMGVTPEDDEEKIIKEIVINLKCLHITQCMLQNVEGNLQQNMHLVTMLNNLVVPAVRSHEAPIRERGLLCLGLCCLLDQSLAEENITLFIHCFSKGHDTLQVTALQILCDIVTTHPSLLRDAVEGDLHPPSSSSMDRPVPVYQAPLLKCFTRALRPATSPPVVQSTAATSLSKLLLTSRLQIPAGALDDLLRQLITSFFDPRTLDNASLRQSLAYFLLVFAHSRLENCERMARIAVKVVVEVLKVAEEFYTLEVEEDSDGEVDESGAEKQVKTLMATVVGMLGEWTDGRKVVMLESVRFGGSLQDENGMATDGSSGNDIQLQLAGWLLDRVLTPVCHAQERKYLLTFLGKLYIPPSAAGTAPAMPSLLPPQSTTTRTPSPTPSSLDAHRLEVATTVKQSLDEVIAEGLATDAAGKNTLVKTKNSVLKYLQSLSSSVTPAVPTPATTPARGRKSGLPATTTTNVRAAMVPSLSSEEGEEDIEAEDGPVKREGKSGSGSGSGNGSDNGNTEQSRIRAVVVSKEEEKEEEDEEGNQDGVADGDMTTETMTTTRMMETLELE